MGGSAAVTSVAAANTSTLLLAGRATRMGATVFNDSSANLYLKLGTAAAVNSYTCKVAAGGYYETPFRYTDEIYGIWDAVNGNARITDVG